MGTRDVGNTTVATLYSFKIFRALISTTVPSLTRPSGEEPRKGNLGLTHNPEAGVNFHAGDTLIGFCMALASLSRPYLIQYVWKSSASISQMLCEINLNVSTAAFGSDSMTSFPTLKAA